MRKLTGDARLRKERSLSEERWKSARASASGTSPAQSIIQFKLAKTRTDGRLLTPRINCLLQALVTRNLPLGELGRWIWSFSPGAMTPTSCSPSGSTTVALSLTKTTTRRPVWSPAIAQFLI